MKVYISMTNFWLFYTSKYQTFSIPSDCNFSYDYTIRNGKFGVAEI